jgi:hypothetical protein
MKLLVRLIFGIKPSRGSLNAIIACNSSLGEVKLSGETGMPPHPFHRESALSALRIQATGN